MACRGTREGAGAGLSNSRAASAVSKVVGCALACFLDDRGWVPVELAYLGREEVEKHLGRR